MKKKYGEKAMPFTEIKTNKGTVLFNQEDALPRFIYDDFQRKISFIYHGDEYQLETEVRDSTHAIKITNSLEKRLKPSEVQYYSTSWVVTLCLLFLVIFFYFWGGGDVSLQSPKDIQQYYITEKFANDILSLDIDKNNTEEQKQLGNEILKKMQHMTPSELEEYKRSPEVQQFIENNK